MGHTFEVAFVDSEVFNKLAGTIRIQRWFASSKAVYEAMQTVIGSGNKGLVSKNVSVSTSQTPAKVDAICQTDLQVDNASSNRVINESSSDGWYANPAFGFSPGSKVPSPNGDTNAVSQPGESVPSTPNPTTLSRDRPQTVNVDLGLSTKTRNILGFEQSHSDDSLPPDVNIDMPSPRSLKRKFGKCSSDGGLRDDDEIPIPHRRAKIQHCLSIVKDKMSIPAEVEADVQAWAEADAFERAGLLYTRFSLLQHTLHETLFSHAQVYVIPHDLIANLQAYTWKLGLSPHLKEYQASWASIVIAAMREARVAQLPPTTDEGQNATISSKVNDIATKFRHYLQDTLAVSIGFNKENKTISSGPKMHITTLARTLSSKCSIAITVELLRRLAVLRFICYSYHQRHSEKDDFWAHVDKQLFRYSSQNPNPADFKAWMQTALEMDMTDYPRTDGFEGYQDTIIHYDQIPEAQKIVDRIAHAN
ncbi:hypothetical protein Clacol_002078 [Clathrus columnatus]|uniref:Uncharacterized protein n=1 Tax=Clathrus columnatus TaxID=1419009 RepID=A0AAV5A348_9AGAM|nr:hypothetical protein Clacol_002078 [Clathrus columnatus]